jgi:hypothetical protein
MPSSVRSDETCVQRRSSKIVWKPTPYHRLVRRIARLKRHRFGVPAPTYVEDVFDIVEPLNFFLLVPTFIAIWSAPRHFFRRLPNIKHRKIPLYATPLKYLWYSLLFTVLMAFLVYPHLPGAEYVGQLLERYVPEWATNWFVIVPPEQRRVFLLLLLFCALSPLWMVSTSGILLLGHWLIAFLWLLLIPKFVLVHGQKLKLQAFRFRPTLFSVPLCPLEVYRHVDRSNFHCGLFYFGITSFLMFHVVGMAVIASYYGFVFFISNYEGFLAIWPEGFSNVPPQVALVLCILVPMALGRRLLVAPYVELIRWTQRTPFFRIQRNDFEEMQLAFDSLRAGLEVLPRRTIPTVTKITSPLWITSPLLLDKEMSKERMDGLYDALVAALSRLLSSLKTRDLLLDKEMSKEKMDGVNDALVAALSRLLSLWKIRDFDLRNSSNRASFLTARQQACRATLPLERIKELINERTIDDRTTYVIQCVLSQLNDKLGESTRYINIRL